MDTLLKMLKTDLGITHNLRDDFLKNALTSSIAELVRKGIALDVDNLSIEDLMLVSDYTAYNYRHREDNTGLSQNLLLRIRNRQMRARGEVNDL